MNVGEAWFLWAVASTVLSGIHSFLYQKLIRDGADALTAQVVVPAVLVAFSACALAWDRSSATIPIVSVGFAVIQGLLFFTTTKCRLDALQSGMPAQFLYPIIKTSTIMVVVLSGFIFGEWATLKEPKNLLGVCLALGATWTIVSPAQGGKPFVVDRIGLQLAAAALLSSAGATLAAKFAFVSESGASVFSVILISSLVHMILATGMAVRSRERVLRRSFHFGWIGGVVIGILNFAGFAMYMRAVQIGELSLIASITSLYILFPILLSDLFHGEAMGVRGLLAIGLSLGAILLIR